MPGPNVNTLKWPDVRSTSHMRVGAAPSKDSSKVPGRVTNDSAERYGLGAAMVGRTVNGDPLIPPSSVHLGCVADLTSPRLPQNCIECRGSMIVCIFPEILIHGSLATSFVATSNLVLPLEHPVFSTCRSSAMVLLPHHK